MGNRDIIVIGGSAGATAPLNDILGRLPADLPAAVFVVLHIPAQGIGILSTASAASRLPGKAAGYLSRRCMTPVPPNIANMPT